MDQKRPRDLFAANRRRRVLYFILALYAFAVLEYVTATIATFFVDRDAEEPDAELAGQVPLPSDMLKLQPYAPNSKHGTLVSINP